ncbi:MAG: hypothetical protein A3I33_00705 [Candidatus Colwellbacteria bacterium RIFCSPLOWO2_02_FULL_45_11]|uniref:Vitamin K epoxide reductase domain-containing protein n=1 Tax=Candidatus Colwellbacteria bacterium RIFCSPLOWO2_02_FULL_45_11 TaxID=1797692 RepID=A0A1G1ZD66_9BACT|nr:MAG: hypothetical protein A3I33_00705 [Candidatus Colwellbacteria bacterium RIFCSPLOWO2_02_FULL_45_11]
MQQLTPSKIFVITLIVISVIGFSDATYLTAKHYLDDPVTCSIFKGCETVTESKYSTVFNIPIALFGVFYYLFVSVLLFLYMEGLKVLKLLLLSTTSAFFVTLFLVYLQAFVLNAFCMFCIISAVSSTALFAGTVYIARKSRTLAEG